jgi:hypothetical protein
MNNYTQEDAQAIVASVLNHIIKCSSTSNEDVCEQQMLNVPYRAIQEIASVWQLVVKK